MAEEQGNVSPWSLAQGDEPEYRVKTETPDPAESEAEKGTHGGPLVTHSDSVGEFWRETSPEGLKQEPVGTSGECWETQWQKFVKVSQPSESEQGDVQPLEFRPRSVSPSSVVQRSRERETQLFPARVREIHQRVSTILATGKARSWAVKVETPEECAASPEIERQCFRQFCYQEVEGPREVCGMLRKLCYRWLQPARKTKEQILELVILEQFLNILPEEMQSWVRGREPTSCFQAVSLAEEFLEGQQENEQPVLWPYKARKDCSETGEALPGSGKWPIFREIKEENPIEAPLMGDDRPFWKDKNSGGAELPWMLPAGAEQVVTQYPDEEETSKDEPLTQLSYEEGGEPVHGQQDFKEPDPISGQQRTLKGEICPDCGKSFLCKAKLVEHQRMHSGEKPYTCSDCGKSFCRRNVLVAHQRIHTGEKPFNCSDCGKKFNQRSHLTVHEKTHTQEKPFACPDCGQSFSRRTGLVSHQRIHTGEKPYHCPDCGKNFRQRFDLIRHQRIHTGEKPHECPDCDKCFRNKSAFLVHRRIHTEEKPYPCSGCGKSFRHRTNLLAHERIHTGEKPYKCTDCDKSFGDGSSLMKHRRAHTGEKPYKCLECGKCFSQNAGLVQHEKIHTGEKPFPCPWCEKSFRDKSAFIVHQRTHTKEKPYSCSWCGKCFSHRSNLLKHERIHTGEKPYKCKECGKGFTQKPNLLAHESTHLTEKP